tara:strand:+ start:1160 stop:1987 length:828 start_codon:yes stop_codon:yes gene_type:complete
MPKVCLAPGLCLEIVSLLIIFSIGILIVLASNNDDTIFPVKRNSRKSKNSVGLSFNNNSSNSSNSNNSNNSNNNLGSQNSDNSDDSNNSNNVEIDLDNVDKNTKVVIQVPTNRNPGHRHHRRENPHRHSYSDYQVNKDYERVINPTLPPERSFEKTYGIPVNIPTRGMTGGFQQVGILSQTGIDSEESPIKSNTPTILGLFGRPTYNGSRKWSYYTASDKYQSMKIPLSVNGKKCDADYGCDEIYDGDIITLPEYNATFKVTLYDYDKPRYIPYV